MKNNNWVSSKIPNTGKTIFAVMSEMAQQYHAVDLSRGFPNFSCDNHLVDLYVHHLKQGHNQYAPVNGLLSLRARLSGETQGLYGTCYEPKSEITITAGATQAIYTSIAAFIKENDEVIIIEPAYDCYAPAVRLNGGIPVFVELKPGSFNYDWEQINQAITANTRMVIINSPHNPTGTVFSALDAERLKKAVNGTNILILSDEVYEHIIFDGNEHESLSKHPSLAERSIIVKSFGKTYHATGWRLGYAMAPQPIMSEFRKVHQYLMYTANTPAQYAFSDYLEKGEQFKGVKDFYQEKRDYFLSLLKDTPFVVKPCLGTYFQCVSFDGVSALSDLDFAFELTKEAGVAVVPVSPFYKTKTDHHLVRFCFAKTRETLDQARDNLVKYFNQK